MRVLLPLLIAFLCSSCGAGEAAPAATPVPTPAPSCQVSWPGSGLLTYDFVSYSGPHADAECLRQVRQNGWRFVNTYDSAHVLCSGRLPDGDEWQVLGTQTTDYSDQLCRGVGL